MKYIGTFLGVSFMLMFCTCSTPKIHKTDGSIFDNDSLMPFGIITGVKKVGTNNVDIYEEGYINVKTFEIVIPAEYKCAGQFTGNFAFVQRYDDKIVIINKGNEIVLSGFDASVFYQSEDGSAVFALTRNDSGRKLVRSYSGGMSANYNFYPTGNRYRLYNLSEGVLLKEDKRKQNAWFRRDPEIMFVDKYLIYDNTVYEILENGRIKECAINKEELFNRIIEARNLQEKEYSFHFNGELAFDSYFWYMDMLDIDLLIQNIPENMQLRRTDESDWRFRDGKPVYYINPINRELNYPLRINNLLYEVDLEDLEDKTRYGYTGLYNSSENNWAVPPMKCEIFERFTQSGYNEWIIYNRYVYNIITRKKYRDIFRFENRIFGEKTLTYQGYYKYKSGEEECDDI
jgi:hypothetical protein